MPSAFAALCSMQCRAANENLELASYVGIVVAVYHCKQFGYFFLVEAHKNYYNHTPHAFCSGFALYKYVRA